MAVIGGADGDADGAVARPAAVDFCVGLVVGDEAGARVAVGVGVGVAAGVGVGVGVGVAAGVGVGVGVGVAAGVGVGVGVGVVAGVAVGVAVGVGVGGGLTDRPQLSVRMLISRRENARKQLSRFRFIAKNPLKCARAQCIQAFEKRPDYSANHRSGDSPLAARRSISPLSVQSLPVAV